MHVCMYVCVCAHMNVPWILKFPKTNYIGSSPIKYISRFFLSTSMFIWRLKRKKCFVFVDHTRVTEVPISIFWH